MCDVVQFAKVNFRAQPIICAHTQSMKGIELLNRHKLDFNNPQKMLMLDVEAIKVASQLEAY